MALQIFRNNINQKHIEKVTGLLKNDGLVILPTDTVYALACSLKSNKAFQRLCKVKNIKPKEANFSLAVKDFKELSEYTIPIGREVFRLMKNHLPGPYTFILNASKNIPDLFHNKKKTIGIRIPDNEIITSIITELGNPLIVSSVTNEDEILDYHTDVSEIESQYGSMVDLIVDGGYGELTPSTIIDATGDEPVLIREGKGKISQ